MTIIGTLITALLGLGIGFFVGRWFGMSKGTQKLSTQLDEKEQELNALKSGVNEHFTETARLFGSLTDEYKNLYQHLAKGAGTLSDTSFKALPSSTTDVLLDAEYTEKSEGAENDDTSPSSTAQSVQDIASVKAQQPLDYAVEESDDTAEVSNETHETINGDNADEQPNENNKPLEPETSSAPNDDAVAANDDHHYDKPAER